MEIKYEAVFGDQSLFYDAQSDCEMVGNGHHKIENGIVKVWNFTEKQWADNYKQQVTIVAMRRIIRTPTWRVADQKAGRLPDVGAKVDGGVVVFVNSFNVVTELESGAVIVSSPKTFLNTFKPIESPEEKAARLREEWVDSAITETEKRKDTTTDEYERLKARVKDIYDALLSGDLPVPVKGE